MDNFSVLRWSRTFVVACAKKTCELPVYYNTIRNFSKVQLKLCRRRTALSSLPQNPAPEPSAPPALIQNTSLRCDWFSCHLPESGQCFQNLQWSGARPKCRQNILPSSSWRWFSRLTTTTNNNNNNNNNNNDNIAVYYQLSETTHDWLNLLQKVVDGRSDVSLPAAWGFCQYFLTAS